MKIYEIPIIETRYGALWVEAESADEAKEKSINDKCLSAYIDLEEDRDLNNVHWKDSFRKFNQERFESCYKSH